VLLLHGFPELAYSWRHVLLPLAAEGFHVVAPDQRGYGRTTGWSAHFDQDLRPFSMLNLVTDTLALTYALGARSVATVVGHDFGSPLAAWCALVRPDVFRSVVMMSAPFPGPPELQAARQDGKALPRASAFATVAEALAQLNPPRKHYMLYYGSRTANAEMTKGHHGLHAFLRAYFHHKSADWTQNKPFPLKGMSTDQLAQLPTYYVMDLHETMPETVAHSMPSKAEIEACRWLPDKELAIYTEEYERTGFQGGLNWYRAQFETALRAELALFSHRKIDVPSMFIAGKSDWGIYQNPGAFERLQTEVCTDMRGSHLIDGAGHWVMQERPVEVTALLNKFCRSRIGAR
jgi:pimeloyl-ACP methyl ester carboxylesterase